MSVINSLGVASTTMTLAPEGVAHLTQVLTNLYADKHLAVLREYSTNALAAHVAAGTTAPVEVTLPTALNPTLTHELALVITDHGIGLSRDEIVNVYARYGASTKRGTNSDGDGDAVGVVWLGLGQDVDRPDTVVVRCEHRDGAPTVLGGTTN